LCRLASAVSLVGDWALSAKLVDADDIGDDALDVDNLPALKGPGPVPVAAVVRDGVVCPPL